jgi:formate hydrogenlyase subunit 3/multisubunit Na+/H+ antiporter MnhD subunit
LKASVGGSSRSFMSSFTRKGSLAMLYAMDGLNCYFVVTVTIVTVTCSSYKITFRDHRVICDLGSQLKPVAVTGCVAVDFSYLFHIIVLKFSPSHR